MNKFAEFIDRFLYYSSKNLSTQEARQKAIAEMLAFGMIQSEEEIERDKEEYMKKKMTISM